MKSMIPGNWLDMLQDKISQTKNFQISKDSGSLPDNLTEKEIDEYLKECGKHDK